MVRRLNKCAKPTQRMGEHAEKPTVNVICTNEILDTLCKIKRAHCMCIWWPLANTPAAILTNQNASPNTVILELKCESQHNDKPKY